MEYLRYYWDMKRSRPTLQKTMGEHPSPGLHIPESIELSDCGERARCSREAAVGARGSLVAHLEIHILVA